jgi:hypothetical protein
MTTTRLCAVVQQGQRLVATARIRFAQRVSTETRTIFSNGGMAADAEKPGRNSRIINFKHKNLNPVQYE